MDFWNATLLGNTIADYAVALGIFLGSFVVARVAHRILRGRLLKLTALSRTQLDDLLVQRVLPPVVNLVPIGGAWVAKGRLAMNRALDQGLEKGLLVLALVAVFLVLVRLVHCAIEVGATSYAEHPRVSDDAERERRRATAGRVKKQVREISSMVLWGLSILTVLSNLGVDLKAIWASLGIGGIALVVAVKEPLANLVGRMYIYGTGIFDEGHFIVFGEWSGTVTKIGLFRTYLELFTDMTTASIPNAHFVTGAVKSYFGRQKFMYKWDLDVPYDTTADDVRGLVGALRTHILAKTEVNPDRCWIYLDRLGAHSKVVRVWFQVVLPDWSASLFYGDQILHELQHVFDERGLEFAFPTQTLHIQAARLLPEHAPSEPIRR